MNYILRNDTDRAKCLNHISMLNMEKPQEVTIKPYSGKRSLDQNAISHAWYNQISAELHEDTPEQVKCECKLRIGVPIMRAENADFRNMYDNAIRSNLSYEEKLEVMRYLPVTSLMNKAQLSRYLELIQQTYAMRGVVLEFPNEYGREEYPEAR